MHIMDGNILSFFLIIILFSCIIYSCNLKRQERVENRYDVIGKYENTFDRDASHYVELKADSTFIHYYKKADEQPKENRGIWSLLITTKKTEVKFDTWIDYGYKDESSCNGCYKYIQLVDGEMIFSYDLPNEMNFVKK